MHFLRTRSSPLLLVVAMVGALLVAAPASPAQAEATHGCQAAGCNGLNPANRCDGDAKTVAAMHAGDGMLELRWSPSCVANWGRFTAYRRTEMGYNNANITIHARVTSWNPGGPSYGTAHSSNMVDYSSWSLMTDGSKKACTGVEITHAYHAESGSGAINEIQSQGWIWGPCY